MGNILTVGGRIKWNRVWIYISPLIFANIVIWYWTLVSLPATQEISQIHMSREVELRNENRQLKVKYRILYTTAREKISFVQGQKSEMNRLLAYWHDKAVALEMQDIGIPVTVDQKPIGSWSGQPQEKSE